MKNYDSIMIGFGKAAKTLALDLAQAGERVAIIEQSRLMYGGTCINEGCIPSKSLINSSRELTDSDSFETRREHYRQAIIKKNNLTSTLRQKNYDKIVSMPNAEVIDGHAEFMDAHTLRVSHDGEAELITGTKIFINTGSYSFVPPVPGLRESKYLHTSKTLMELPELPLELLIIGGGYIGLEFASLYADFGSKVTVLQNTSEFMGRDDREIAAEILNVLSRKIEFRFETELKTVTDLDGVAEVVWTENGQTFSRKASAVLAATGRRPNIDSLNLSAAGIAVEKGAIKVDELLRTTAPNVWALGDCKGGLMFTYISLDDYRIVKSQLSGGSRTSANRGEVPYSVFINPVYSHIGMTAEQASAAGYQTSVGRLAVNAIPKAKVLRKPDGLLKAVIDAETGLILGVSLFCEESYEMINLIKLAMDHKIPYTVLRDEIYTHPTMSEAFNDLFKSVKLGK